MRHLVNMNKYLNQEVLLPFSLFGPFTDQNDRFPCSVNVHFPKEQQQQQQQNNMSSSGLDFPPTCHHFFH